MNRPFEFFSAPPVPLISLLLSFYVFPVFAQTSPAPAPPPAATEPVRTSITVTENVTTETPANVTELTGDQLEETPGVNLDDRLRQVPGFSLFRRNSSVIGNPTTQGISLRGIGSSGASRSLVLFDGVPMNDPFGGWVYWTRFTPDILDRVEISRGASTSIFGDLAMGGAVATFSPEPKRRHFDGGYRGGSENTQDVWLGYTDLFDHWAISASGRAFRTDGFYIVPENLRGTVDRPAGVNFFTGTTRIDGFAGDHRFFAQVNILGEERQNGTVLQTNSTSLGTASLHYVLEKAKDEISLAGFVTSEGYHQVFTTIAANRNSETLSYRQSVPSDAIGGDALWTHSTSEFQTILGADVNRAHGIDTDHLYPTGIRTAGGTILQHGIFAQTNYRWKKLVLFAGARYQWTGLGSGFFSPSGGAVYGVTSRLRLRGSLYRAFRSPTLNELYRQFRQGNTLTLNNPNLQPEKVFGAEIGVDYSTEFATFRVTAFRNSLGGLISNVTLSSTPSLITRQRQNAANALDRGFEIGASHRWHDFRGQLSYLYVDNRYVTGLRVAQVPRNQGTAELIWDHRGTMLSSALRAYSLQFDDDANQFILPGYMTLQFMARRHLKGPLSATAEVNNALNREYLFALTPTPNVGMPRVWMLGFRWN